MNKIIDKHIISVYGVSSNGDAQLITTTTYANGVWGIVNTPTAQDVTIHCHIVYR